MRRGPQPNFVRDRNGNVVNGLRIQRAKNRSGRDIERFFAVDAEGRRKYFGNSDDRATAILRFRQWEAQQDGDTVAIRRRRLRHAEADQGLEAAIRHREIEVTIDEDGDIEIEELLSSDAFWETVRDLILTNPQLAAQRTGIEQLAYLHRLEPPPPSKPLEEIISLYLDDKKGELTPKEWKNSRTWWDEFAAITAAKFVADLDREQFRRYRETVKVRRGDKSPVWVRSRFGKIKTVINYSLAELDLSPEDQTILKRASLLKLPPKPTPDPKEITPQELRAILKKADEWITALILTGLNCAYGATDCRRLQWSMIDFEKGVIRFDRTKAIGRVKGAVPRVAVLWKRTITALRRIQNDHSHVFVSTYGRPVHVETIRRHWNDLCQAAGVERDLEFGVLRKSAQTAAASSKSPAVPYQQYQVLSGHAFKGVDDNYIRRNPRLVELACEAIERYYFGQ